MNHADENRAGELARNVAVALRFKKSQGTPDMPKVEKEVLAPHYDRVWMQINTNGAHQGSLYTLVPTGRRVGVPVVAIMQFTDGKWQESWTFADELGLLLQLGIPNLLLG